MRNIYIIFRSGKVLQFYDIEDFRVVDDAITMLAHSSRDAKKGVLVLHRDKLAGYFIENE